MELRLIKKFADVFSKKDKITGLRTLNISNDEVSKQKSQMIMNEIIKEAKSKGIRVLQFRDVDFERAKKSLQELMGEENMNLIWISNVLSDALNFVSASC